MVRLKKNLEFDQDRFDRFAPLYKPILTYVFNSKFFVRVLELPEVHFSKRSASHLHSYKEVWEFKVLTTLSFPHQLSLIFYIESGIGISFVVDEWEFYLFSFFVSLILEESRSFEVFISFNFFRFFFTIAIILTFLALFQSTSLSFIFNLTAELIFIKR